MKPTIYLIGVNHLKIEDITDLVCSDYNVKRVPRAGLVTAIYKERPSCIVIVESDLDSDSLSAIDSILTLEYIPTICISYNKTTFDNSKVIDRASYIQGEHLDVILLPLLEQAGKFSKEYNEIHMCYDTFEIMNEEVRKAIDTFTDTRLDYSEKGLVQYLDMVYKNNLFLSRRPQFIWLLQSLGHHDFHGRLYDLNKSVLIKELHYTDEGFSFKTYSETGFFKNKDSKELSDITHITDLIPVPILRELDVTRNVACYAVTDVMLIAVDYNGKIEQVDLNILKAMAIKIDLMVNIKTQVSNLEESFVYTMNALARAAEGKDDVTGHHIKRVNLYSKLIAKELNKERDFINQIEVAAQMHDVGKILISDEILNKPGKLTDDEYRQIQLHTVFGQKVIGESDHLLMAASIARHHHEKYDGSGYPDGLKGVAIPMEARIVSMADIYDALRSPRPYKKGFTHEESYDIIVNGDGRVEPSHFDPAVLEVFIKNHQAFNQIYASLV